MENFQLCTKEGFQSKKSMSETAILRGFLDMLKFKYYASGTQDS